MTSIDEMILKVGIEGISDFISQLDMLTQQAIDAKNKLDPPLKQGFLNLRDASKSFMDGVIQTMPAVGTALKLAQNPAEGLKDVFNLVGSSIKGWVESADEAATVDAKLKAVLKSTGGVAGVTYEQVNELASSLAELTLFEDDAIKSSSNLLLTFTDIGKDIFPRAQAAVLDLSTAFGQDLKSSAIQLGKAMQDPVQGVSALRRVGVQLTDAQEDLIKSLVATGQTAKAQELILGELERQTKGSAEAAAAAGSGPWKQFQKAIGEIGESIGAVIIPVFNLLASVLRPIAPVVIPLVAAFAAATAAVYLWNTAIVTSIKSAGTFVLTSIPSMITGLGGMAASFIATVGPIGLVAAGMVGLAYAFGPLLSKVEEYIKKTQVFQVAMQKTADIINLTAGFARNFAGENLFRDAVSLSILSAYVDEKEKEKDAEAELNKELERQNELKKKQLEYTLSTLKFASRNIKDKFEANRLNKKEIVTGETELPRIADGDISRQELVRSELTKTQAIIEKLKQDFKELGPIIKTELIQSMEKFAFNIGFAIAQGKSLADVFKQALAEIITTIGTMVGVALINSAMGAPFPLSLGLLAAGLAVLGLSGLLSGALSGGGKKKDKNNFGNTGNSFGSNSPVAGTGLGAFGEAGNEPTVQTVIYLDGEVLSKAMGRIEINKKQRRKG